MNRGYLSEMFCIWNKHLQFCILRHLLSPVFVFYRDVWSEYGRVIIYSLSVISRKFQVAPKKLVHS